MKKRNRMKKLVLVLGMVIALCPVSVFARESLDRSKTGSISLTYACADIDFSVYKVASWTEDGEFVLDDTFSSYAVSVVNDTQSDWKASAEALDGYITRDGISADMTGTSDSDGKVVFSDLEVGLYLVTWEDHDTDGYHYTSEPVYVSIPSLAEDDSWIYDVEATLKYGKEEIPETVDRRVHKVWSDDSNASKKRPESIEVELLQDGIVYETVTLNSDNEWSYEWTDLSADYTWKVVEKTVVSGYTVGTSLENDTYLITNTLIPEKPEKPEEPELPQTGMLWWPVGILVCGGLVLFGIGYYMNRKSHA